MTTEVYPRAPIVEAAYDVRVRSGNDVTPESLSGIRDPNYPDLFRSPTRVNFRIEGAPDVTSAEASNIRLGFMYRSSDQSEVFQVRTDGFTYNKLAPYQNWAAFSSEGQRLWSIYREAAKPAVIELISLTYINELFLPMGERFETHFRTYIEVPKELPQEISSFVMNYQLTIPDGGGFIGVAQAYGPPKKEGHVTVNLNISASRFLNDSSIRLRVGEYV
jgi:uncharacterized protein (TIGR04255 family)